MSLILNQIVMGKDKIIPTQNPTKPDVIYKPDSEPKISTSVPKYVDPPPPPPPPTTDKG